VDATGAVSTETDINDAGPITTAVGKTWADNGTHTLAVAVDQSGKATYYYDGARLQTPPVYTFDAGDVVVPFLRFDNTTDIAGQVVLQKFEAGFVAPQGS
jgi:hypothetical protein